MILRLLDTNAVIALVGRRSAELLGRIEASEPGSLAVSSIVAHELWYGAYRSQKVAFNLETLRLPFSDLSNPRLRPRGCVRRRRRSGRALRQGTLIGPYDVLIAGQARARGLILVTNNTGEFCRVAGLDLEDWTAA